MEINDNSPDAYNILKKSIPVLPDSTFLNIIRLEKIPYFEECILDFQSNTRSDS